MERLTHIGMLIVAAVIAALLLILGCRTLIVPKSRQRWAREFWFSVLIIMAIAYSLACSRNPNKLEDTPEWKAVVRRWEEVSGQLHNRNVTSKELESIVAETNQRLDALQKLANRGLISPALLALIRKEFVALQAVRPIEVMCYSVIHVGPQTQSWLRLKERLPLLEKALNEGKINEWTYQKIIPGLKDDLEALALPDAYYEKLYGKDSVASLPVLKKRDVQADAMYKSRHKIKDEDIEAVKTKTRELIDRAEKSIGK